MLLLLTIMVLAASDGNDDLHLIHLYYGHQFVTKRDDLNHSWAKVYPLKGPQSVQNTAARLMSAARRRDHTTPLQSAADCTDFKEERKKVYCKHTCSFADEYRSIHTINKMPHRTAQVPARRSGITQARSCHTRLLCATKDLFPDWKCIHSVAPPYLQEFCVPIEKVQGRPLLRSTSTGCVDLPSVWACTDDLYVRTLPAYPLKIARLSQTCLMYTVNHKKT